MPVSEDVDEKSSSENEEKMNNLDQKKTPSDEKPLKLHRLFLNIDVILGSAPFIAISITIGLQRVFLNPILLNICQIPEENMQFYFMIIPAAAIGASFLAGPLVNIGYVWSFYVTSSIIGTIGCCFMCVVVFCELSHLANQILMALSLVFLGYCTAAAWISEMIVLDNMFAFYSPMDKDKMYRIVLSVWNTSICFKGGKCLGSAFIGGILFDHGGYGSVVIVHTIIYVSMFLGSVRTFFKFRNSF